ncbi:hypothetical protein BOTBODRAFT_32935 [Botryobasidium botryosum FD-172 SS1]|uniref:Partial AB-hydrolase lipase domain-containing protein n=1 Tax=Botryobasidium botryosum (strain FD-172 SS1) TaxID=930990 RepID=A0A067MF10_BOTB1|nr:hypothetical protein BOTBODRAFT_32935 [Botryobasidium botryosum FD-172 SS1]
MPAPSPMPRSTPPDPPAEPQIVAQVHVDSRQTTPEIIVHELTSNPPYTRDYLLKTSLEDQIRLLLSQAFAVALSSFFLSFVLLWAIFMHLIHTVPLLIRPKKLPKYDWDTYDWGSERISRDMAYYAQSTGFDITDEVVETKDGFLLRVHHVTNPKAKDDPSGKGHYPILILHGLFQSSGSFVTSEERSLAFWLASQGYDVFLGNTRCVFDMGHKTLPRGDPRTWDWTIRELAMYDFPALVDYVCQTTGHEKIAYIGHSQGTSAAFLSLSKGMNPELGKKLSCFIALAPAVYAGPLTRGFPFGILRRLNWTVWSYAFGVLDFIPIMKWAFDWVPSAAFGWIAYIMFSYLFNWTDSNWLKRRKGKMFRFTPMPVSSASIFWWCGKGGFADRRCIMDGEDHSPWYDERFPPLSIYYGGRDYLVLTEPLLERLEKIEKDVRVTRVERIELAEHCDFYWAADAVEWCFGSFVEDIERSRAEQASSRISSSSSSSDTLSSTN